MDKPQSVLILKLSSLGDVVHALPLANTLKKNLDGLRLGWVVERGFADIVKNHPAVDDVFVFERGGALPIRIRNFFLLIRRIRSKKYDIIIDLQGSMKSVPFILLGGARGMGFKRSSSRVDSLSTFFTGLKVEEPGGHIAERYLAFARVFGIEDFDFSARIKIEEPAARAAGGFIKKSGLEGKKIIIIHPGAAWKTKIWPSDNYAELIDRIHGSMPEAGAAVAAGKADEGAAEYIRKRCRKPPALARGLSLGELSALIDRCDVFIGSDSGPLHLAAGLGKSVLGLYGPTDEIRNGPFCARREIIKSRAACAGCWKRACPGARCMEDIKAGEVFEKLELLAGNVQRA